MIMKIVFPQLPIGAEGPECVGHPARCFILTLRYLARCFILTQVPIGAEGPECVGHPARCFILTHGIKHRARCT